jgi:hypothetical protein
MMITFPVLMLAGKIDWNEDTLFIGRLALSSVVPESKPEKGQNQDFRASSGNPWAGWPHPRQRTP